MTTNEPLVTVNILSFNRKDDLRNTLKHVFEQDYKNIEVIVVDNASSDGTGDMILTEYPLVKLIQLQKNIGIAGWNEGFKVALGEFVLVLDDDSYPQNNAILLCVQHIINNNNCGVAACHIENKNYDVEYPWSKDKKELIDFIGCGAILRKSIVHSLNGFSNLLFLYAHELEYSMRVINSGYKINYVENATVIHMRSPQNRITKKKINRDYRHHYYFTRNLIIIALLHFHFHRIGFKVFRFSIGQLIFGLVRGGFFIITKAILSGYYVFFSNITQRSALLPDIQEYYLKKGFMPGFFGDGLLSFKKPIFLRKSN